MKNFAKFILLTFFCTTFSTLYSDISYRMAKFSDISQLLKLHETIEENRDDSSKLVILPKEIRETSLRETISRGRLFVAINTECEVISFLKLYLIESETELTELLKNELRCIPDDYNTPPQLMSLTQCNPQTDDPTFTPCRTDYEDNLINQSQLSFEQTEHQTFIYYGGAYTKLQERKKGHGSFLLKHAFSCIREKIVKNIRIKTAAALVLAYGQVIANQENTLMRRAFAKEIPEIQAAMTLRANRMITFSHYVYKAPMPAFIFESEHLIQLPDPESDERDGRGNLIVYQIPRCHLTNSQ